MKKSLIKSLVIIVSMFFVCSLSFADEKPGKVFQRELFETRNLTSDEWESLPAGFKETLSDFLYIHTCSKKTLSAYDSKQVRDAIDSSKEFFSFLRAKNDELAKTGELDSYKKLVETCKKVNCEFHDFFEKFFNKDGIIKNNEIPKNLDKDDKKS